MSLLNSFFCAKTHNPYIPSMELVFEKTTSGTFEYKIPQNARHIMIEIAGGNGLYANSRGAPFGAGGRGGKTVIFGDVIGGLSGKTISGTVGASATSLNGVGGSGNPAGGNGGHTTPGGSSTYGGGGGGATSVVIEGTLYRASGGGGATFNDYYGGWYHAVGGKGGGENGGAPGVSINQAFTATNGGNATDLLLNETNNGYVRVWTGAVSKEIFTKATPGAFSYVIPNNISLITIEIAAGNGSDGAISGYSSGSGYYERKGGRGSVKVITLSNVNGKTITGIVGQSGGVTGVIQQGGSPDGYNGSTSSSSRPQAYAYGGGGGGHSECTIDNINYIVSGGAGGAAKSDNTGWAQGGRGGGPNPGLPVTNSDGGNATDGDKLNLESTGYIKIFAL